MARIDRKADLTLELGQTVLNFRQNEDAANSACLWTKVLPIISDMLTFITDVTT